MFELQISGSDNNTCADPPFSVEDTHCNFQIPGFTSLAPDNGTLTESAFRKELDISGIIA